MKDPSDLFAQFLTKPKVTGYQHSKKIAELQNLYNQTKLTFDNSYFSSADGMELAEIVVQAALMMSKRKATTELIEPFFDSVRYLAYDEYFFGIPEMNWDRDISTSDQIEIRKYLEVRNSMYGQGEPYYRLWAETLIEAFAIIFEAMPSISSESVSEDPFSVSVIHLLDKPQNVVEQVLFCFFGKQVFEKKMFQDLSETLDYNASLASGFHPDDDNASGKKLTLPTDTTMKGIELSDKYLGGTVLHEIFKSPFPIEIPISIRFEHTHILAGTGFGKTQLIQKLILDDLKAGRGFCVIDSQGDMIRNITMLAEFDPQVAESLSEKLVIINPTDTDYPACLNMFAMSKDLGENVSSYQKELLLNATVDLYGYIFGALFGAELTSKQGTVFAYIARLMIEIPDANIQTLRELMEDGRQFIPYMKKLEGSAKAFFKTQFFTTTFAQSKKQVLSRLWAVLSNATLERLFSNTENRVNVSEAMNEGKILLINTAKDLLQKDGTAVLGRFFIALLSQAIIKRTNIPENERSPYMVYIDEAHEYFDYRFEDILNQARKYKVGFTLSHQNIGQLHELKSTVASSTSVKLAGGVSAGDAQIMAREMRTTADEILNVRKGQDSATFSAFLKNITPSVLPLTVKFGLLEKKPVMSEESFRALVEGNREKYCNHISEVYLGSEDDNEFLFGKDTTKPVSKKIESPDVPEKVKPVHEVERSPAQIITPPPEKKGGIQHLYLQNLVKKVSNERGFKATIEKKVLSGAGSIDVAIEGYETFLAVEISVTTDWKWEASNISKCLATGADHVIILSSDKKHLQTLKTNLSEEFSNHDNLSFLTTDQLISHLDDIRTNSANSEKTVKGYKVKVNYTSPSKDEALAKKDALARVLIGAKK